MAQDEGEEERKYYDYRVSLRIWHPTIDPSEITAALDIQPSHSQAVGQPRTTPKGHVLNGINRESFWMARLVEGTYRDRELAKVVSDVVGRFKPHGDFLRSIRSDGGRAELFIGWFFHHNSGDMFTFSLLGALSDICMDISFDVYMTERYIAAG